MSNTDPPDTFEKECSWCSNDPRPSAFCCKACEDASHEANEGAEQRRAEADSEQGYRVRGNQHDGDLRYLASRGR